MTENPLVSVCVQTFQHKNFIAACIRSILDQKTDFAYEIIIGEDASTDGTREICLQFAEQYPDKIRLFLRSEEDKIYVMGEKTGRFNFLENLKAAKGKYIALMDGDDYWVDEFKLQKQTELLEQNPQMALNCHNVFLEQGGRVHSLSSEKSAAPGFTEFTLDDLLKNYFLHMSAIIFRREYILDLPAWFKEVLFIDYPLSIHLAAKGSIGFMNDYMGVYRIHKKGVLNSKSKLENEKRLWKAYTVLANHFSGKINRAMRDWRYERGDWLVWYYRGHIWHSSAWLEEDLKKNIFPEDEKLLGMLKAPFTRKNFQANLLNIHPELKKLWDRYIRRKPYRTS